MNNSIVSLTHLREYVSQLIHIYNLTTLEVGSLFHHLRTWTSTSRMLNGGLAYFGGLETVDLGDYTVNFKCGRQKFMLLFLLDRR